MALNIGSMRTRITLQKPVKSRSDGSLVTTWTDVATVWAAVHPLVGKEYHSAMQEQSESTHKINMRYRSDIRADWRIKLGNRELDIASPPINIDERNVELVLYCKERVRSD